MSSRPLLALGNPSVGKKEKRSSQNPPRAIGPGRKRQAERLTPQFRALAEALANKRLGLDEDEEIDPELVVVFEIVGSVKDFCNAVEKIPGLEFMAELLEERHEPDDDFYVPNKQDEPSDKAVAETLQVAMTNAEAAKQIVRLFEIWTKDEKAKFEEGLNRFRDLFDLLRSVRKWGPEDRVRDTGLLEEWDRRLKLVGQSTSNADIEIELWYRKSATSRAEAESAIRRVIESSTGEIVSRAEIPEIGYHAILARLPIQQVRAVVDSGPSSIEVLTADEVMFVSPNKPMSVSTPAEDSGAVSTIGIAKPSDAKPRIAVLDGLPLANHDLLADRLVLDDPDEVATDYPVASRVHGTAMASLILHGDLSAMEPALERKIYVRPIMRPDPVFQTSEQVPPDILFPDLLHRSIRRMFEGGTSGIPAAPSVRIVNLSVGTEGQAFVRRMSPSGRLLDWLATEYNVLFVVSAGNHHRLPLEISGDNAQDRASATSAMYEATVGNSKLRGILPPGDSINALTVAAAHADAAESSIPDDVWNLTKDGAPAHYGATGPGFGRSIKPELIHDGGRAVYTKPIPGAASESVRVDLAESRSSGPGQRVASPGKLGSNSATSFTHGTSNAAALVTRAASSAMDVLERGSVELETPAFPGAEYHPVLAKALLVHATEWGNGREHFDGHLPEDRVKARRFLTSLLGYGRLDLSRLAASDPNRAVMIGAGSIGSDEQHTFGIPLPTSLNAKADWHRISVTLAYFAPTASHLNNYRIAKVFFDSLDDSITGSARGTEAMYDTTRRGCCQHEMFESNKSMVFSGRNELPLKVVCMDDAKHLPKAVRIRYGLIVSIETRTTVSNTVYDEVRDLLQTRVRIETQSGARAT